MTRPRRPTWPVPTDTALDRARTIARGLLALVRRLDPAEADKFEAGAAAVGETWLVAQLDAGEDRLTVADAAALVQRRPATIRKWISRGTAAGRLVRGADGRVDRAELLELDAAMRRARTERTDHDR